MARTFSVVTLGEYSEMFAGFVTGEELQSKESFLEAVGSVAAHVEIKVEVLYLAFMDYVGAPVEPATEEELCILYENLEELVAEGYIELVDEIEIALEGEDTIIIEDVDI